MANSDVRSDDDGVVECVHNLRKWTDDQAEAIPRIAETTNHLQQHSQIYILNVIT